VLEIPLGINSFVLLQKTTVRALKKKRPMVKMIFFFGNDTRQIGLNTGDKSV